MEDFWAGFWSAMPPSIWLSVVIVPLFLLAMRLVEGPSRTFERLEAILVVMSGFAVLIDFTFFQTEEPRVYLWYLYVLGAVSGYNVPRVFGSFWNRNAADKDGSSG